MEIPRESRERDALYLNLMRSAELASRTERRDRFRKMRALALTGTETSDRARFNSLREWMRLSSSLVYNAKGLNFGLVYPPYYGGQDPSRLTTDDLDQMTELAREELHRAWFDSDMPTVCGMAVTQAHYTDTSWVKMYVNRNEVTLGLIPDPSDMCVGDERQPVSQQEVFVHFYSVGLPQFLRMLQGVTDPSRRAAMWEAAQTEATAVSETRGDVLPGALPRIILASASPTMVGSVANTTDTMLAQPKSREPVVTLAEMWVWDDRAARICSACHERKRSWRHDPEWVKQGVGHEFEEGDTAPDWRVVTIFDSTLDVLWDPVNPLGIEGHAFFPLCLEPDTTAGYAYGIAPMENLIGPQLWSEQKWAQLDARDDLDLNPPLSGYGIPMRDGEVTKGWRKPGADIPLSNPNAKVEFHRPPVIPDRFEFIDRIDRMRRLLEGIPKAMAGETGPGQTGEQMVSGAMLGAGPTLDHAMVVEGWIESIATAVMRLHRNILDRPLVRDNGERFLLRQMPGDFVARVWAHSASPIYTEHIVQKAMIARKTNDISGEDFLLLLNLPATDILRRKHKKLEQAQAEKTEKVISLKEREVGAKEMKAMK